MLAGPLLSLIKYNPLILSTLAHLCKSLSGFNLFLSFFSFSSFFFVLFCFCFLFFGFFWLHLWYTEVPRSGVKWELQLPAYTTAQQCWIQVHLPPTLQLMAMLDPEPTE